MAFRQGVTIIYNLENTYLKLGNGKRLIRAKGGVEGWRGFIGCGATDKFTVKAGNVFYS